MTTVFDLPGVNMTEAIERVKGNYELYLRLLKIFKKHYTGFTDKIGALINAGNIEDAKKEVHKLKGAAGNLAATELLVAVLNLERVLKENRTDDFQSEFQNVHAEMNKFLEALRNISV